MNEILRSNNHLLNELDLSRNNSGLLLVDNMISIFALVETMCDKHEFDFLCISNNLKKYRETNTFDIYLNATLSYLQRIGDFEAREISASNGYTITELHNDNAGVFIHTVHTFDPKAQYKQKYLAMNSDLRAPRYAIFRYDLNADRTKLKHLEFAIPSRSGRIETCVNLMPMFIKRKMDLCLSGKDDAITKLQQVKMQMNQPRENNLIERLEER